MAGGQKWTFRQLRGPKKVLELTGYAAPFGRPRKEPIVDDELALRLSVRRYAGNDTPTYHVFGLSMGPWELHGRWMDSAGGAGFAKAQVANVKSFIADAQPVSISWGSTRTVSGLVEKLVPSWESETDVAWKLTIQIASDLTLGTRPPIPNPRAAESYTNRLLEAMSDILNQLPKNPPSLKLSLIDSIDSFVTLINAPGAILLSVANQISTLETSTIAEIRRFRAGLHQYVQAITSLRASYESLKSDSALAFQEVDDEIRLMQTQAIFGKTMAEMLQEAARADKAASDVERAKIKAFYSAKQGDTWEQVAVSVYGSTSRIGDILKANGVDAGSQPVAGSTYSLPV
jgi:hypothetical protein